MLKLRSVKCFRVVKTTAEISFWITKDDIEVFVMWLTEYKKEEDEWELDHFQILTEGIDQKGVSFGFENKVEIYKHLQKTGELEYAIKMMKKRGEI